MINNKTVDKQSSVLKWIIVTFLVFTVFSCTNETKEPQPTTPIFAGLASIELTGPNNGATLGSALTYNAPSEVKYLIVGLFDQQIATSGTTITNPQNFKFGSRTGLADFVAGSQTRATMHAYDTASKNFVAAASSPTAATYYWAVWGYDQYGNLTHCSPQRSVVFP